MSTRNKSSEFKKGIKAFIEHVESLERSDDGFINEYVMIQEAQMRDHRDSFGSMEIGKLEPNLKKNRYKDIVPYDECRIVLSHSEGDDCSDYINASKITGVNGTAGYIASQGPLSWTVDDFWRMIWEYDVEIVFMACKLVEMKKIKCSQYWGDVGTSVEFGNITVFTVSEQEVFAECIQRTFRVTNGNEVHHVTQLHHYGWPDHGIPENPDDIRDVIGLMRNSRQNCKAPVLVHCSAGCGRTGTIIAIDYVWTLLENGNFDESFSLYDLICNFRKQRVSLVQTPDQYALVNKVLRSLCEEMLTKIASHTYENVQFNQEQSNNEGSQQRQKKPPYLSPKSEPRNIAVNITPMKDAPARPAYTDSSQLTSTHRSPTILQRLFAPTHRSKTSSLKTFTTPSLPASTKNFTERSSKSLPRSLPFAERSAERNLSSKERSAGSGSKTLKPQPLLASTKSFTEQNSTALHRSLSTAERTTERNFRTVPQPVRSNHKTADEIRRPLQSTFSAPQNPQDNRDKAIINRKWSSVKSQRTPTQTVASPHYENVVLSQEPKRLSTPSRSTSVKEQAGTKVCDFSRRSESRREKVRPGSGTKGMPSSTLDSEVPVPTQKISDPSGKLWDVHRAAPPVSPRFKGYVLLTPGEKLPGEDHGNNHV